MGTRSHIVVKEGSTPIVVLYSQYDGYLSGVGKALAEFLEEFQFTNGYGYQNENPNIKVANGPGCFAAQLVLEFKRAVSKQSRLDYETNTRTEYLGNTIGSVYLRPSTEAKERHDYTYEVIFNPNLPAEPPTVTVWEWGTKIATKLSVLAFKVLCEKEEVLL